MSRYNQPIADASVDNLLSVDGVVSVGEALQNGQRVISVGVESEAVADRLPATVDGMTVVWEIESRPGALSVGTPLLPEEGDGLPSPAAAAFGGRQRPVPPGVSISHAQITAGTSSFLATDGNTTYQLSNNHVLARKNEADVGDPILQPGSRDGGSQPDDVVGQLSGYVPWDMDGNNPVDVAWYEPSVDVTPVINRHDAPTIEIADPELGDEVTWVGRTSGVATGIVDKVHAAADIGNGSRVRFVDQFRIDNPLIPGDSGSPLFLDTDDGPVPVGLGFAGSDTHGWANYISNVESETGLSILPVPDQGNGGGNGGGDGPSQAGGGAAAMLLAGGLAAGYLYQNRDDLGSAIPGFGG